MAHNFNNYTDHRGPSPANSNLSYHSDHSQQQPPPPPLRRQEDSNAPRHRSTMSSGSLHSPHTPIDEAVNTAFNKAQHDTSNAIPPDLIAKITQNVIQQLQTTGLDGAAQHTPIPPSASSFVPPAPQTAIHHPIPQSPSTNASGSSPNMPNRVYTPPSPQKHPDYVPHTSPEHSQSGHMPDAPQSPIREGATHFSPRRASSPHSQGSEVSEKEHKRPKGPSRLSTGKEETTLERIWGQLFDEEGHPTMRVGQFLRGLAVHIVRFLLRFRSLVYECANVLACRSKTTSHVTASSSRPARWPSTMMT